LSTFKQSTRAETKQLKAIQLADNQQEHYPAFWARKDAISLSSRNKKLLQTIEWVSLPERQLMVAALDASGRSLPLGIRGPFLSSVSESSMESA